MSGEAGEGGGLFKVSSRFQLNREQLERFGDPPPEEWVRLVAKRFAEEAQEPSGRVVHGSGRGGG